MILFRLSVPLTAPKGRTMFDNCNSYGIYNVTTEVSENCAHTRARSQEHVATNWSVPTVINDAYHSADVYASNSVHAAAENHHGDVTGRTSYDAAFHVVAHVELDTSHEHYYGQLIRE